LSYNNLERRTLEHKNCIIEWFTSTYKVNKLVYFEEFNDIYDAIRTEKKLKNWHRDWKINLIEKDNPNWIDLSLKF
jgi:putative endonuclease